MALHLRVLRERDLLIEVHAAARQKIKDKQLQPAAVCAVMSVSPPAHTPIPRYLAPLLLSIHLRSICMRQHSAVASAVRLSDCL